VERPTGLRACNPAELACIAGTDDAASHRFRRARIRTPSPHASPVSTDQEGQHSDRLAVVTRQQKSEAIREQGHFAFSIDRIADTSLNLADGILEIIDHDTDDFHL
jgi:RNA:NAD 2'-phosphotransferase (TPT1/KptA family)